MFDLSIWEIAIVAVVAILVIGPRELPRALVTAGKWIRKFRSITSGFRSGLDNMIRETEMKELEGKWAQQNQQIMAEHPNEMLPLAPSEQKDSEQKDSGASSEDITADTVVKDIVSKDTKLTDSKGDQ